MAHLTLTQSRMTFTAKPSWLSSVLINYTQQSLFHSQPHQHQNTGTRAAENSALEFSLFHAAPIASGAPRGNSTTARGSATTRAGRTWATAEPLGGRGAPGGLCTLPLPCAALRVLSGALPECFSTSAPVFRGRPHAGLSLKWTLTRRSASQVT